MTQSFIFEPRDSPHEPQIDLMTQSFVFEPRDSPSRHSFLEPILKPIPDSSPTPVPQNKSSNKNIK
jgi:hypothetical protein